MFESIKDLCDFVIKSRNGNKYDSCQHKDNIPGICCRDECPILKEDDDEI